MCVAQACNSVVVPSVGALNMHLGNEVPAKGVNTTRQKMNSDSSHFILTPSEQEHTDFCVLILNDILLPQRALPLLYQNLPLKASLNKYPEIRVGSVLAKKKENVTEQPINKPCRRSC